MKQRFDSHTKRGTNSKALQRLTIDNFLKDAGGSPLKAFNALGLRIDQLAAVATPDQQSDHAKITVLLRAIERTSWFIAATAGTDRLPHFTSVVERINHELAKMAVNDPSFSRQENRGNSDRMRIVRDVLYALGDEATDDEAYPEATDEDGHDDQTETEEAANGQDILFAGQRRYGKPPGRFRGRGSSTFGHRWGRFQRRDDSGPSKDTRHGHGAAYDRRCFNCGEPECTTITCPEPRNPAKIEAKLTAWRKSHGIDRDLRHFRLADIDAPS